MTRESEGLIHPTAVVDKSARVAPDVAVGPYAIVGAETEIGEGCRVEAHAVIGPYTKIGRNNMIHHYAVIGTDSQDAKYRGERSALEIGDNNIFREFVTINRATGEGGATRIGSNCRLMAYSHVAHNTRIGDGVILSNCAEVGGEVEIEPYAILGGLVGVHQFCRIGAHAIVGACSKVTQDILPYVTADGHPARPRGLNTIGLKRRGFSSDEIAAIKSAYRLIFLQGLRLEAALDAVRRDLGDSALALHIVDFIVDSIRNIARPRGRCVEEFSDAS